MKNLLKGKKLIFVIMTLIAIIILAISAFVAIKQGVIKKAKNNRQELVQQTTVPDGYIGIYNATDLANIANDLTANYILMSDIDMTGVSYTIIAQNSSNAFTGTFDGNGYEISNLSIESTNQYVGLFGYTNGATIKNLDLENISVKSTSTTNSNIDTGSLIGYAKSTSIYGIKVYGNSTITSNSSNLSANYTGGIIGDADSNTVVERSVFKGNIIDKRTNTNQSTFISGITSKATIKECYSSGTINVSSGNTKIYGIGVSSSVENCYSTIEITGTGSTNYTEIYGISNSAVTNSYFAGKITLQNKKNIYGISSTTSTNSYYIPETINYEFIGTNQGRNCKIRSRNGI